MPFIEHQNNNLPYSNLPYAFKSRLIQLASLVDARTISIACSDLKNLNSHRRKSYTTVYITDNRQVSDAAKAYPQKESDFNLLYHFSKFSLIKYILDGPLTINPTWQTVLRAVQIAIDDKPLYINDTLILYLLQADSYDRMMPLVAGTYARLVLYGQYTWTQVKQLIHSNVKKVRIMGNVDVEPEEYDDAIQFVLRFPRGIGYKYVF
uniref:F-box domain-containing protein n=1 Tax=Panagrellus redivivus TaxID=6233 RepID=A0A7E4VHX6_PANRE